MDIHVTSPTQLIAGGKQYRCCIGANGFTSNHAEGGKTTPLGTFALRSCWYRPDRLAPPETGLKLHPIAPEDGWCDDPANPDYNRYVKLPFAASHEVLWRKDSIYDLIVSIGYNDAPIVPGAGSAIFFHLTQDYSPTLGCVAVSQADMLEILPQLTADSHIRIGQS